MAEKSEAHSEIYKYENEIQDFLEKTVYTTKSLFIKMKIKYYDTGVAGKFD